MFQTFKEYCEGLRPALSKACQEELSLILGDMDRRVHPSVMETLQGGKAIRGCLLCVLSEVLGGTLESAMPRAVAVELIHAATLVHDDFVDQDRMRRGRAATWTLEGARKAVLLGDVIFASAIEMMSSLSREDGLVVSHTIAEIAKGAYQEPIDPLMLAQEMEQNRVSGKLYEKIIHLKTAILFGAACRMGAMAAAADADRTESFHLFGTRIGEIYQIADDIKEVTSHLSARSIRAGEMALLAPALLYFTGGDTGDFLPVLRGEASSLKGSLLERFKKTLNRMAEEIEQRLTRAVFDIETDLPDNAFKGVVRTAPRDLIQMFNES